MKSHDEKLLAAFRYIGGELGASEEAAFEQTLAEDVEACDAVGKVVHLALAVREATAAEAVVAPVRPADATPLPWFTAAATLLVIVCLFAVLPGQATVESEPTLDAGQRRRLAEYWRSNQGRLNDWPDAPATGAAEDWRPGGESSEVTAATTPAWLVAAVRAQQAKDADVPEESDATWEN